MCMPYILLMPLILRALYIQEKAKHVAWRRGRRKDPIYYNLTGQQGETLNN